MIITNILVLIVLAGSNYAYECDPNETECETWLTIRETLTMIYKKNLVYAENSNLYKYDEFSSNFTTNIPMDDVITVDGVPRMVTAVNDTIPAPDIIVYEGQMLTVHVKNMLLSESASIHWHGLHQKGTPFMDGVAYISQCPIGAGQTFTYHFKAEPKGTFWYHSHIGAQRTNGLFGAFIIKEKPKPNQPADIIMTLGDWHHSQSTQVYIKMVLGNFEGKNKYKTTDTLDGGHFSGVPWVSALINGKGRFTDQTAGETIQAPITWFNVTKGNKFRFRMIAAGTIYPLRVSVDNHMITVAASDGYDLEEMTVESIIINPGERFDFFLDADQAIGNYWVRAESMEVNVVGHSVEAVLHYVGADDNTEPTTQRKQCTTSSKCDVVNCPFLYYPVGAHTNCIIFDQLEAKDPEPTPEYVAGDSQEHFLNFAFPGQSVTPGAVNGRKFEFPGVSSLTQPDEIGDYDCKKHDCGEDKVCYCHYSLDLPYDKTIQMTWLNMGSGKGWSHPIHLHGHSFYVLKMGYAVYNQTTGKITGDNPDIDCRGNKSLNFCNAASWSNSSWLDGNVPGLNLKNPPRKDTIMVPTGGYVVLRIRSNNPGKWFAHCHIEVHALDGMAFVVNEAPERHPSPPPGFPICQNFYNDKSRDVVYKQAGSSAMATKILSPLIGMIICTLQVLKAIIL